ncbi:MAG: AAA family ATPase [Candidatus Omnitrophota bacterium]
MSDLCLIIGQSGTGKSRSIFNLDPKETMVISTIEKPLPFRGWKQKYKKLTKENGGNLFYSDDHIDILKTLKYIDEKRKEIKIIVIDDFQYLMVNEFMRKHSSVSKGNAVFGLYNEIADHAWSILWEVRFLRSDLMIFVLAQNEIDDSGRAKIKTIGRLLDEKITIEGMFSIVLNTAYEDEKYFFETQTNGLNTTKSPEGMFNERRIPNDLKIVCEAIKNY